MDSEQFSKKLDQLQTYQTSSLILVTVGSLGPDKNVYDRCSWKWKLSDLTSIHQMARALVLEQIYHAFMVQNNNPYHKQCTKIIPAPSLSKIDTKQEHPQRFRTASAFLMKTYG